MKMISLFKEEYERIKQFEEETLTDYGMKKIIEDELEHYYINEDNLLGLVADLLVHYHRKVEEVEDLKEFYETKKEEE